MYKSLPYWTLDDALSLIRGLQPVIRKLGYHLCLGGGVLNNGESKKDLDLYFLAINGGSMGGNAVNATSLITYLVKLWGPGESIGGIGYPEEPIYPYKMQFRYDGLRIDVFVIGGTRDESIAVLGDEAPIYDGDPPIGAWDIETPQAP